MKKNIVKVLSLVLTLALILMSVGCDRAKYSVVVNGGTGGGEFAKNEECTVTATVPEGKEFVKWTCGGEEVSTSNPYTFSVTDNIELTAEFGSANKFTVNVTGGTIAGEKTASVSANTEVEVTASVNQARKFIKWQVNGVDASTANPYKFTVTGNTEVVAIFDQICLVSVTGGTVNEKQSDRFTVGEEATIIADSELVGQRFSYWYILNDENEEVTQSTEPSYSFTVSESIKFYAKYVFLFLVTVENGHIGESEDTSEYFVESEYCTLTAAAPEDGEGFIGWFNSDDELITTSNPYRFAVIKNTALKAEYGTLQTHTLTIPSNNASANLIRLSGGFVELDRAKTTLGAVDSMFVTGTDYVKMYIFTSRTSNDATEAVGTFKIVHDKEFKNPGSAGYVMSMDEKIKIGILGEPGNYYIMNSDYDAFKNLVKYACGYSYSERAQYYFAAQMIGEKNLIVDSVPYKYTDSAFSVVSTFNVQQNASATAGFIKVTVIDGLIDGELESVQVGYGVTLTLSAEIPQGKKFAGWVVVTDDDGTEVLGEVKSYANPYTFVVTFTSNDDLTLRARIVDEGEALVIKLATPSNANNEMINFHPLGMGGNVVGLIYYDRHPGGATAFVDGVDYIKFYVYTSNAADADAILEFKIYKESDNSYYISRLDGASVTSTTGGNFTKWKLDGTAGNLSTPDGNAYNYIKGLISSGTGGDYNEQTTYYFATQAIAITNGVFEDSDISAKGSGFKAI